MSRYIGYDLKTKTFRDELNQTVSEDIIRDLWDKGELDCTLVVQRLILDFQFDGDALIEYFNGP